MSAPTPPTVRIGSDASARDVADLARLRVAWRVGEGDESGLDEASFATALATWMREHPDHLGFIGSIDEEAVAMAWMAIVHRVPGPGVFVRTCAYVQSAYVAPEHRNDGVGTAVMTALIEHGRGIGLDYIAVHPSERSFPFYRRLGFRGTERVLELDFRPGRGAP
jgi:GNAT superfamily N-acetyltransferase